MLEKLKLLLGVESGDKDALLSLILGKAEDTIKAYTHRLIVPDLLSGVALDIAVIFYNRLGTEGETARTEGSISQSFCDTLPQSILLQLNPYRRVGVINADG